MLICPFCKVENSNEQRVCGHCGQSLPRWYSLTCSRNSAGPVTLEGAYLDTNCRYQRIGQPIVGTKLGGDEAIAQLVLDCQPHLDSPLKNLQSLWLHQPTLDPTVHRESAELPTVAIPYLALQADHFPAVPELHDVLQTEHHIILVLEDRTTWPSLLDIWPTQSLDPLQQLQWLFEITLLWQALAPWQAQATLLNPARLVLNPNRLVCLTQIDSAPEQSLTLQALGQAWQQYYLRESVPASAALKLIIQALADNSLTQLSQLQADLAELAGQYRENPALELSAPSTPSAEVADMLAFDGTLDWTSDSLTDEELIQLAETQAALADDDEGSDFPDSPTMILPMKLLSLEDAGQSHVGQQRSHNEDWFFTQTEILKVNDPSGLGMKAKGLYILCDGMGGHAAGEVASRLAVNTLQDYFARHWQDDLPDQQTLTTAIIRANQVIFDANQAKATSGIGRMGTTLVLVLVQDLQVAVVHVGDSRLYSYCKRLGLRQLTVDHEVGQREIKRGVEPAIAYARPDAYQLTQALGPRSQDNLRPEVNYHEIVEDTLLILCSDGLSDNNLLERYETSHVAPLLSAKVSLDQGVAQLIQLANEKNGHDNITAILVRLKLKPDVDVLAS